MFLLNPNFEILVVNSYDNLIINFTLRVGNPLTVTHPTQDPRVLSLFLFVYVQLETTTEFEEKNPTQQSSKTHTKLGDTADLFPIKSTNHKLISANKKKSSVSAET